MMLLLEFQFTLVTQLVEGCFQAGAGAGDCLHQGITSENGAGVGDYQEL